MVQLTVLTLFLYGITAVAAAGSACSSGIYALLQPLSTYTPAQSFCSSKFPLHPCTSLSLTTTTVVSSVTAGSSFTATANLPIITVATVTSTVTTSIITSTITTSTVTSTVTTSTSTSTIFTSTATLVTAASTVSICTVGGNAPRNYKHKRNALSILESAPIDGPYQVTAGKNAVLRTKVGLAKRGRDKEACSAGFEKRATKSNTSSSTKTSSTKTSSSTKTTSSPSSTKSSTTSTSSTKSSSSTDTKAALFSSLTSLASAILSTACSCIETPAPCSTGLSIVTTTSTMTITPTLSVVATTTVSTDSTTTLSTDATTTASTAIIITVSAVTTTTSTDTNPTTTTAGCLANCTPGPTQVSGQCYNNVCDQALDDSRTQYDTEILYAPGNIASLNACQNACSTNGAGSGFLLDSCNAFWYDGNNQICQIYQNLQNVPAVANLGNAYGLSTAC